MAGIPYRSPHKVRNGHGVYITKKSENIGEFKSFSLNMMHSSMQTTDSLYGQLANDEVGATISNLGNSTLLEDEEKLYSEFLKFKN